MMRRLVLAFAALALMSCGQTESVMQQIQRREAEDEAASQANATAAAAFMQEVRARPGVTALPSGLAYEFNTHSSNARLPRPTAAATVLVHYEGKLPNGEVFDSSFRNGQPVRFGVREVVPGFGEAVTLMRPGDEITAYIPPELGYGPQGSPPTIPGNSALIFRIRLLAFDPGNGHLVEAPRG